MKSLIKYFLLSLFLLLSCGITDYNTETGSIQIILDPDASSNSLKKFNGELFSVRAIIKRDIEEIYNKNLNREGDRFKGRVTGLAEGSDYSIRLYGNSNQTEIAVTAFKTPITVKPYRTTKVQMTWELFCPTIISPQPNDTFRVKKRYPFNWTSVLSAEWYHLQVASDTSFQIDSLKVNSNNVPYRNYAQVPYILRTELPEGDWYCRVKCRGYEGLWGPWSEMVQFNVDYPDD